ncbi:MAG TPA: glycosyltransferase family 4 protein [Chthoniobacterales bacterium]|nr:glycosyltransferase family 4 protein [Chthoniobacterales bacterium]
MVKTLAFRGGGAERVLTTLTTALANRGHDVAIATFDRDGAEPFFATNPSVDVLLLGVGEVGSVSTWREVLDRSRALRRLARDRKPDVAIGFLNSAYVPLTFGLVGTGVPVIASEHIVYQHYRGRHIERLLLEMVYPVVTRITAVSDVMQQSFPSRMRRKMAVLRNPVESPERYADIEGGATKTVLSVGRLEPQKDHATLISAFQRIANRCPEWRLKIIGEGSLRRSMQAQIDAFGLHGRIHLPGAVKQVGNEYAAAQLFVLPSRYESFGLATAEAMAHGLPVVGFADCPGTNELIEDGVNGLLVPGANRVEQLADTMAELMSSPASRRRLGEAGRITRSADLESIVAAWEEMLSSACSARSGSKTDGIVPSIDSSRGCEVGDD